MLHRALHILLTAGGFFFFFLGGTLLSYLILPLARLLGGSPAEKARRCRRVVGRAWVLFHDYARIVGLVRFDPRRANLELPPPPFVMVANHPTLVDVTALVSAHPDLIFVAKPAVFRSPLVGRLLRQCDHIESGDGGAFSGAATVEQALARLREGTSVLIFPEGTRSPERGLGAFQPGAFRVAALAGVPLVPVLVTCQPPSLMRGQPWYSIASTVMTLRRLPSQAAPQGDARAAARAMREAFAHHLQSTLAPEPAGVGTPAVGSGSPAR